MSWRQIHSSVAVSESLSNLSSDAERLYWRMLAQTDAWGRLEGRSAKVRAKCVPMIEWTTDRVEELLSELEDGERIQRYGEACQLLDFDNHQPAAARRRGSSTFPPPPDIARSSPDNVRSTPAESRVKGDLSRGAVNALSNVVALDSPKPPDVSHQEVRQIIEEALK